MENIKIGLILPYLKSRGTEKQALRLARGFVQRGAKVVLFVLQGWGDEHMYRSFRESGIEVINVGTSKKVGVKKVSLFRFIRLGFLVKKEQCSVLLSRAKMTNRVVGFASFFSKIPAAVVISNSFRNTNSITKKSDLHQFYQNIKLGIPWRIIFVSEEGAEAFNKQYPKLSKKVLCIHNGVELDYAVEKINVNKKFSEQFNLCYAGSLELKRKGIDTLLESLNILVNIKGYKKLKLNLIGSGLDEDIIKQLVEDYDLNEHVRFLGEQENPLPLMNQSDIFVLPSRKEGLPNALLEAMSIGMCVISTDCYTGPKEIISNGVDGILVPVNDAIKLAEKIEYLMTNPNVRVGLGNKAIEKIRNKFTLNQMVDNYFNLLLGCNETLT